MLPEVIIDGATPPNDLTEDKRNGHAHQTAVLYNESLVPRCVRVELLKRLGLSGI